MLLVKLEKQDRNSVSQGPECKFTPQRQRLNIKNSRVYKMIINIILLYVQIIFSL